jgi:hypothetical protein
MNSNYKFSNEVIVAIVKLLQLAMITGTDITDWFKMIETTPNCDGLLELTESYRQVLESQIASLEAQAETMLIGDELAHDEPSSN